MGSESENRRREYFQTYRSEPRTLAVCADTNKGQANSGTYLDLRLRVRKEDHRLPMFVTVAFEPDGGSPDDVVLSPGAAAPYNPDGTSASAVPGGSVPTVAVAELVLLNHSYAPINRSLGNLGMPQGPVAMDTRKGSQGMAIPVSGECDAVDIFLHLVQALGAFIPGSTTRYGGRWSAQYCFTCVDRLSREEWEVAVNSANMQTDVINTDALARGGIVTLHGLVV